MIARYPDRSRRCRDRFDPPETIRTAIGLVGRRFESQWRTAGIPGGIVP
jgi:hypothetical protein